MSKEIIGSGLDEGSLLDVISKKDRAKQMYDEAWDSGPDEGSVVDNISKKDLAIQAYQEAVEGISPRNLALAIGVPSILAAGAVHQAVQKRDALDDMGSDDAIAALIGIPIVALASYGIYKTINPDRTPPPREGGGPVAATSKPWLYKLNPAYWFKTSREKRFIDIEKERGVRNVEAEKELVHAERAFYTTQAASARDAKISEMEAGLKQHGISGEENRPFAEISGQWLKPDSQRDSEILARLRKAGNGQTIKKGARFDYNQSKALFDIVNNYFVEKYGTEGKALPYTEAWMAEFVEKMKITYTDHDGTIYVMKNKIRKPVSTKVGVYGDDIGCCSGYHTIIGSKLPGMDPKLDKTLLAALKRANVPVYPGATLTHEQSLRAAAAIKSIMKSAPEADKWYAGFLERNQINWVDEAGATKGIKAGRIFMTAPAMPTISMRGTAMPLHVVKPGTVVDPQRLVTMATQVHRMDIEKLVAKAGLAGKKTFTVPERDKIAAGLMKLMMKESAGGLVPKAADAHIARSIVTKWGQMSNVNVPGDTSLQGNEIGINPFLLAAGGMAAAPAAWWLTKKAVVPAAKWTGKAVWDGTKWVGRQVARPFGYKGKKKSPAQLRQMALIAAAKSEAAAKKRILAAEKKHEAAIAEREEERRVAEAEAKAAEAAAAADEAEAIAIKAEAEKGLRGTVESLEGWSDVGRVRTDFVGRAARLAALPTLMGQRVRMGAAIAQAAQTNPAVRAEVKATVQQAKAGNKVAQKKAAAIQAGAAALQQKQEALVTDAQAKRAKAKWWKKKIISYGRTFRIPRPRLIAFGTRMGWWKPKAKNMIKFRAPRPLKKPSFKLISFGSDIGCDISDPAFYMPRQAVSAQKLASTKSSLSLRPSKSTVKGAELMGHSKESLDPAYYMPRQAIAAQKLAATKSSLSLRPVKSTVKGEIELDEGSVYTVKGTMGAQIELDEGGVYQVKGVSGGLTEKC